MSECPAGDLPSVIDLSNNVGYWHSRIGKKHLVKRVVVVHFDDLSHFDTRLAHVDQEIRDARMFRYVPVGAGDENRHVGIMGHRVPHLLAIDHPLVSIANCGAPQAGKI